MAYTKQNFTSGQVLKASHMNNIETAIVDNENAITALNSNMSNKANTDHTHDEYLTSIPSEYKTQTENDSLYQPIGDYVSADDIPTKTSQLTNDSGFISELPTIPTKTSELTNDSSFATENYVKNAISEAELSGGDVDLSGYATKDDLKAIPTKTSQLTNDSGFITELPPIPTKTSDLTNDSSFATENYVQNAISEASISGGDVDLSDYATKDSIPTKTSQLTNDSGFVSRTEEGSLPVFFSTGLGTLDMRTCPLGVYVFERLQSLYLPSGALTNISETPVVFYYMVDYKTLTEEKIIGYFENKTEITSTSIRRTGTYIKHNPSTNMSSMVNSQKAAINIPTKTSQLTNDSSYITETEMNEAISNLGGGISSDDIEPLNNDIPKVFINGTIPTNKTDVLAELTYISKTEEFHSYIEIKCQGTSSMNYPKKNFTVKLYSNEERSSKLKKDFKGWGEQSKFCLKANYIDHSHSRNIISANLWTEVVSNRSDYDNLPTELKTSPRNGAIDGFPIKVYTNGTYQGIYTWNIPKDDWLFNMDSDNTNHVLLCGETNTDGYYGENACNFRSLWSGVNEEDWSVEVGTNSESVKTSLNNLISCVKDTDDNTFKQTIGNYLDLQSAIDYYLHQYVICGLDGLAKNMLLATYNGTKWYCSAYDMDSTFGLYWDGSYFVSANYKCPEQYQEQFSLLWERITNLFSDELKARYLELRKSVYSIENMFAKFERFTDLIGKDLYEEDVTIYNQIPSSTTNNITQIRNYIRDRLKYVDIIMNNGELPDEELVEEFLVENYNPSGSPFIYTINDFDWNTDYIEASLDLSNCSGYNENILSFGKDIVNWTGHNLHTYYTKDTSGLEMDIVPDNDASMSEYLPTLNSTNLVLKIDKTGFYLNGSLITNWTDKDWNSETGIYNKVFNYLKTQSTLQIGSQEGSSRSNAIYNYIKVVKNNADIIVENYKPNGEGFVYTVNNFNAETDYLEVSMDLSTCQNSDENILSIGNDITSWGAYNFHSYYTRSTNGFAMHALSSSGDVELDTTITNDQLIVKLDKDGIYFDGTLHPNSSQAVTKEVIDYLLNQSNFQVGSQEGSNRSNATYNYIKVVTKT